MFSAFRGIWLVAEQRFRGALRDDGLHFATALRLSGRGKSPGLRPFIVTVRSDSSNRLTRTRTSGAVGSVPGNEHPYLIMSRF